MCHSFQDTQASDSIAIDDDTYTRSFTFFKIIQMITATIEVKPHLAAYLYVRYQKCVKSGAIQLPSTTTLYHKIQELTVRRPSNVSWRETGNLTFVLPDPRHGKNPETYNYLGQESVQILEREIDTLLKMDLYSYLLEEKFQRGVMYKKSLIAFMEKYRIADTNESGLMKAFQRWKSALRKERGEYR